MAESTNGTLRSVSSARSPSTNWRSTSPKRRKCNDDSYGISLIHHWQTKPISSNFIELGATNNSDTRKSQNRSRTRSRKLRTTKHGSLVTWLSTCRLRANDKQQRRSLLKTLSSNAQMTYARTSRITTAKLAMSMLCAVVATV